MRGNVVAVHILQDAPVFKMPIEHLMTRPCCTLHLKVLHWVAVVVGALDLFGMPHIAVVGLNALVRLETVG
jgi:hypothetical protein